MTKLTRLRAWAKWGGTVACVVILVAFGVSVRWVARVTSPARCLVLGGGRIGVVSQDHNTSSPFPEFGAQIFTSSDAGTINWLPVIEPPTAYRYIGFPLWMPFLLLAAPVALLWHLDLRAARRARARACSECGYDRAGLAPAAACPECGAVP